MNDCELFLYDPDGNNLLETSFSGSYKYDEIYVIFEDGTFYSRENIMPYFHTDLYKQAGYFIELFGYSYKQYNDTIYNGTYYSHLSSVVSATIFLTRIS